MAQTAMGSMFVRKLVETVVGLIALAILVQITVSDAIAGNGSALTLVILPFIEVLFLILIIWNIFRGIG